MKVHLTLLLTAFAAFGESPAESSIRRAELQVSAHPEHAPGYANLAMAYARRARETSDVEFYVKAEEVLNRAPNQQSDDFEIAKTRVWLMLGRHDFARALAAATDLNKRAPDDITVWGYLADANVELGNYPAAVDAVQWMFRLRAGNIPALTRAAYLRELHGDLEGAVDLMQRAYDATAPAQLEDRAWLLTQVAHLRWLQGKNEPAESNVQAALELFPDYHYALGALAQIRSSQGRFDDAVILQQRRYAAAPHAENLFAVAEALEAAGRHDAAREAFDKFEAAALIESEGTDNANHELIAYYTDHAREPHKALALAELELTRRHDIYTLAEYAAALEAAGRLEEALLQRKKALATGTRDPRILKRTGHLP